jgi:putative ABC transport system permease protein
MRREQLRLLLRLAPRHLRAKHAAGMEALFRQRLDEARTRGRGAAMLVWLHAARDLLTAYPFEWCRRWRQRGRVGVPAERRSPMLGSDLRYAWRALSHQKSGSAIVVSMLALGIGANVAVFSLINGLFLKPLPFDRQLAAGAPRRARRSHGVASRRLNGEPDVRQLEPHRKLNRLDALRCAT